MSLAFGCVRVSGVFGGLDSVILVLPFLIYSTERRDTVWCMQHYGGPSLPPYELVFNWRLARASVFGHRTPEIPSALSLRSYELNCELVWDPNFNVFILLIYMTLIQSFKRIVCFVLLPICCVTFLFENLEAIRVVTFKGYTWACIASLNELNIWWSQRRDEDFCEGRVFEHSGWSCR